MLSNPPHWDLGNPSQLSLAGPGRNSPMSGALHQQLVNPSLPIKGNVVKNLTIHKHILEGIVQVLPFPESNIIQFRPEKRPFSG
ncbi:MAG: hypothetical protein QM405_06030 [Euryarchaeota archaeon]|jgi:hypothetical protein|nr:hypothetical protein [Euryarchaeota archaeon]HNS26033.1 hypothetical protein [Methanobacteriaceae archaeon]